MRRVGWTIYSFVGTVVGVSIYSWLTTKNGGYDISSSGEVMVRFIALPILIAAITFVVLSACDHVPKLQITEISTVVPTAPFNAQVVGVQWLNPLHRRDYSTEWQLLWTMGLAGPNKDDDMVRTDPMRFSTLQMIGSIADGNYGRETFKGYHHKYVEKLLDLFHDIYFSSSRYFYNAHSLDDKSTWRELAGIHIEYALPAEKLDQIEASNFTKDYIIGTFSIGNKHFPTAWSRSTSPDVHITTGGPNAGFTSLSAALTYLQTHPDETVWAMNWDAPNFPPLDDQINENMVLLVLAGPNYKTGRAPLAWIGQPAVAATADFKSEAGQLPPVIQAWKATLDSATRNAGKTNGDIGYVIHDANKTNKDSSSRIANLAHILALEAGGVDFVKQTFNTPALLGEMGAGTALTNVALAIGYANHFGKNVLVAGTSDAAHPTAVLVAPPEKVRPILADGPWFRARGENNAYLMWWGIRHDETFRMQGYSK
jgi:hypothetical protein